MSILIEPNYWVKLASAQKNNENKESYEKNNWRSSYYGREGCLEFMYYQKKFRFQAETGRVINEDEGEYETDDITSSKITDIHEKNNKLTICTRNTIYTFEIMKKIPNEDTQAYFDYLVS